MSEQPRPSFSVAVVGTLPTDTGASVPGPEHQRALDRLVRFLDRCTAAKREGHRITLTTFTHGVGGPWAHARGHSVILIPRLGGTAVAEREIVDWSDALVVVGDRKPWGRLVRFATEKGIPVRFYAG